MAEERRPAINRDELFLAANDLVADGKRVTATALLDALGGGSLRTIYKYLAEWQEGQAQEPTNNQQTELPDSVLAAFKATWRTATAEAERATAAVREQAAEEVKAAEGKFADALDAIERLESQADQDAQKIEELTSKIAEFESSLKKSQNEATTHKATAEQLQKQVQSLEESRKLDQEEQTKLQKERDHALTEAAKLEGKVETLQSQNDNLLSKLKEPDTTETKKRSSK